MSSRIDYPVTSRLYKPISANKDSVVRFAILPSVQEGSLLAAGISFGIPPDDTPVVS